MNNNPDDVNNLFKKTHEIEELRINVANINYSYRLSRKLIKDLSDKEQRHFFRPSEDLKDLSKNLSTLVKSYRALDSFAKKNEPDYVSDVLEELVSELKAKYSDPNYSKTYQISESDICSLTSDYEQIKKDTEFNLKTAYRSSPRFRKWFAYMLTYAEKKDFGMFNRINKLMGFTEWCE